MTTDSVEFQYPDFSCTDTPQYGNLYYRRLHKHKTISRLLSACIKRISATNRLEFAGPDPLRAENGSSAVGFDACTGGSIHVGTSVLTVRYRTATKLDSLLTARVFQIVVVILESQKQKFLPDSFLFIS